ncbi:UDP-N-acetylglucosamine--N-acetylmuramyl-(pentapeptide) pyrophosphoryl-undecaprenol N-acetylglucosamine transferase [uncultured Desulfobacterium sp.]|uniref:UDP-N-acetylglucosamine--N-acetylmuramyl-(pentapeptide) pyrophosphoryl-undecaprenol N-acetylglucosamine transferase n=1 Tax=uncultured Desulfobacterium sp. TaxID=201089 RepID=A0A445MW40_9BACT|nr:UDP-N-acetylglucosamine--N-acetylmuramyl-(pentapeptide) pyrophosphoryl-undecaprenol N-acetylglucosamine transferase [uncultured Desulfobacterium sp.]
MDIISGDFNCIIAGGGTGGHLFPGIAVAKELEKRSDRARILFVVGRNRMEAEILSRYGYEVRSISVEGIKGRGWKKGLGVLLGLPKSFFQSKSILKEFSPAFVFGVGGYSAGPMCLAARLNGIPTAIHEQNSFPGLTNRLLSRLVDRVLISFEESSAHLKGSDIYLTGNPVREELFHSVETRPKSGSQFTVLVVGGSQGAQAINKVFLEALEYLNARGRSINVIHQTGRLDYDRVAEDYKERGLKGEFIPFIQDMASAYNRADIVVGRAGASTVFELAGLGKPSILIPYPYAANQHQEANALSLAREGGAVMIRQQDLTGMYLAELLMKYMDDPTALFEMGLMAKKMGRPDAAKVIVDKLMELKNH